MTAVGPGARFQRVTRYNTSNHIINKLIRKLIILSLLIGAAACAAAPVQEMSDARQAINSAEEAGAARYSPQQLDEARQLLDRAQLKLKIGAYGEARRLALDARDEAIRAREKASAQPGR